MVAMEEVAEVVTTQEGEAQTKTAIIGEAHMDLVVDTMVIMAALLGIEVVEARQPLAVTCLLISLNWKTTIGIRTYTNSRGCMDRM